MVIIKPKKGVLCFKLGINGHITFSPTNRQISYSQAWLVSSAPFLNCWITWKKVTRCNPGLSLLLDWMYVYTGKINCGASSEPEIIQNNSLMACMINFLYIRDKWRKSGLEAPLMGGIGERKRWRARGNGGWIYIEKEEVEDLYLSFLKVSSLTRVTTVKSVLTLSIT